MLLNLSNHTSKFWKEDQLSASLEYGKIHDEAFPQIDPELSSLGMDALVELYYKKCMFLRNENDQFALHIMGEMCFCYRLITRLKAQGITCLASTTLRKVVYADDVKQVEFQFVQFRKY